jgi:cell division protein FtsB
MYNNSVEPSSPLHQALSIYERRFMLHLCQGRAYADAADLRLDSCRNCILEQAVMVRALRAAVSNLSDHWNNATRTRADFTALYMERSDEHGKILNGLDGVLEDLSNISLHKELKTIARMNGRVMETLLDTVPVEREKRWAAQCQTSYARLQSLYEELMGEFENLILSSNREEEARSDLEAEDLVKGLDKEVEEVMVGLRDEQADRLDRLTNDHVGVVSVVLNAVHDETRVQAAFTTLESMSKASTSILPSMEADDLKLKEVMVKVSGAKTAAMKRMNVRLRQISQAQLKIQRLLKGVSGLRAALVQQCDDMTHIEHLFELTVAYRSFISEIKRRRSYGDAVSAISNAMFERLAAMRNDEQKSRERFLRGSGRHLMPSFYEMFVPTLATQPPLFNPQLPAMVELDSLPDFGDMDASMSSGTPVQRNVSTSVGEANVDSSLTESVPRNEVDEPEATSFMSRLSVGKNESAPDSRLIVSAEGQSGQDIVVDSQNEVVKVEQEAENKTLAYENAILRQKVEELSGQSPQAYIDKANEEDRAMKQEEEEKSTTTQQELETLKKELELAKTALLNNGRLADKISHSSFQVGDVALFMPTGKNAGGKKAYLAFHSNCPHRYLSTDNIERSRDYVLGRIVYQDELVAGVGNDQNPHGLRVGTKFWILTVEVIN